MTRIDRGAPVAPLFLPCAAGVEALLEDEVRRLLPHRRPEARRGGVALDGDAADTMALNLESRLAQRVLVEAAEGACRHENDVYDLARGVDWRLWITPRQTLKVDATAQRSPFRSPKFAALRVKDAVCDHFRDACGERPDVDVRRPDLPLVLHLGAERAAVYVDTSGEPLFKRGWREDTGDAPLKETLAAALLAAAGWQGTSSQGGALHDPCCGAGTIAIEAAQLARGIAPGLARGFAFERQAPFLDAAAKADWQRLKDAARSRVHAAQVPIFASDVSFRMLDFARRNAGRAGVAESIVFHGGDALERPPPPLPADLPGMLMLNPPYGERIDVAGKAAPRGPSWRSGDDNRSLSSDDFFARLAAHWKRAYTSHPAGWTAWVLSPDMKLPGRMRLKETRRVPLWNGPIECRLFRFDLVAGSMRERAEG